MTNTLLRQIALVSESRQTAPGDLARVGAALQKQAARDLARFWNVAGTVDVFPTLDDVPVGYWPIIIQDDIHQKNAGGFHTDHNGEPFSLVLASPDVNVWSLRASHEMIEMLVDPSGNRMVAGDSPKPDQTRVQFLVEPCDPSEHARFAYTVNGVLVSDFYGTHFFDPTVAPGVRYSFTGAVQAPRSIREGGYLSWLDVASGEWWQIIWLAGAQATFRNLGKLTAGEESLRGQIDRLTSEDTARVTAGGLHDATAAGVPAHETRKAGVSRAAALRQRIACLQGNHSQARDVGNAKADLRASTRTQPHDKRQGKHDDGIRHAPCVFEDAND